MAQSKIPAKCCECGLIGPKRRLAARLGWVRKNGRDPKWLCPKDGEVWRKAEQARAAEINRDQEASRAKLGTALLAAPGLVL